MLCCHCHDDSHYHTSSFFGPWTRKNVGRKLQLRPFYMICHLQAKYELQAELRFIPIFQNLNQIQNDFKK